MESLNPWTAQVVVMAAAATCVVQLVLELATHMSISTKVERAPLSTFQAVHLTHTPQLRDPHQPGMPRRGHQIHTPRASRPQPGMHQREHQVTM